VTATRSGAGRPLVTGASGVVGAAICRRLAAAGERPLALVRESSDLSRLEGLDVEIRRADLARKESLRGVADGASVVYHAAAAWRQEAASTREFFAVNVDGSRALAEEAARAGARRFVFVSTVGVHGAIERPPADESAPIRPGDRYQRSKVEAAAPVASACSASGIERVVVRPAGVYGPSDRRFLKLFRAVRGGWFVMVGSGRVLYHLTFEDDVADGIVRAGETPGVDSRAFILAGPEAVPLRSLVETLADVLGVRPPRLRVPVWPVRAAAIACELACRPLGIEPPLYRRRVDFFVKDRAFDTRAARVALGFSPKVSLREGLERTAAAYRSAGWLA
jgi:nucleoside-diphosphate-sugar epimerase